MPAIKFEPPERGTYRFVLRKYDIAPLRSQKFHGYDEVCHSRAVKLNGRVAQTLFVRRKNTRDRAVNRKFGWIDETKAWFEMLDGTSPPAPDSSPVEEAPVAASVPEPAPAAPDEEAIFKVLKGLGTGLSKSALVKKTKLSKVRVADALKALRAKDVVIKVGSGFNTKYEAV